MNPINTNPSNSSISQKLKHKECKKGRRVYRVITDELRNKLIKYVIHNIILKVLEEGLKINEASDKTGINYNTAKAIFRSIKGKRNINQKTLQKPLFKINHSEDGDGANKQISHNKNIV